MSPLQEVCVNLDKARQAALSERDQYKAQAEALAIEAEDTLRQYRLYLDDEDCELPDLSGLESALAQWKEASRVKP